MIKVLLAEDTMTLRNLTEEQLEYFGDIDLTSVTNGDAVVAEALTNKYDVILMDIRMPKLDGIRAAQQIKKILPDQKIIAVSAFGDSDTRARAAAVGIELFLLKPVEAGRLYANIKRMVAPHD